MAEPIHTYSVGDVDNEQSHIVKIVHISDTHWMHEKLVVPDGDVLVHSGDFVKSSPERLLARQSDEQFDDDLLQIKEYFASLPHRYKIFVAGNHELSFTSRDRTLIRSRLAPECLYLHNSHCAILGITFYGAPYTKYRY
jgi:predicted phosphodiesterase